jgi:hypothetical protein
MVDTGRVASGAQPSGGTSPFRTYSSALPPTTNNFPATPQQGGLVVGVFSYDAPAWNWALSHPLTANGWGTTSGTVPFREFMVAFSSTFPLTYSALNYADWAVTVAGSNKNTVWSNTGSNIAGATNLQLSGATAQVLGTSYLRQSTMTYTPH